MNYEYFTDIFQYEKFPVEYECFKQLKDKTDLNYIAVPWTQILNSSWINYPNGQSPEYYLRILSKENIKQQNNFTVCQHDDYIALRLYFKHLNITKVFTPLHDIDNKIKNIDFIPISFTSLFNFKNVKKDILFSFVGTHTSHVVRYKMKERIQGDNIIYRDSYHVNSNSFKKTTNLKEKEELEYKSILERSKYSLCPRGSSPSSVRFWESLHAGCIPILISDNWKLPEWDWSKTIIKIKESVFDRLSYNDIKNYLNNISKEKEQEMRENCKKAYNKFKMENYTQYIIDNL
jgi:hypothetical protein